MNPESWTALEEQRKGRREVVGQDDHGRTAVPMPQRERRAHHSSVRSYAADAFQSRMGEPTGADPPLAWRVISAAS